MAYQFEMMDRPAQPTLVIRTHAAVEDLPRVLGTSYSAIVQCLAEAGESPLGAPFVLYHNMDMQNLDIEVGFPVARPLPAKGEIHAGEIPAGAYAACLYTGPYAHLAQAYNALMQWLAARGYQLTGGSYEFYLNDPNETPPEALQTQILFPVVKG